MSSEVSERVPSSELRAVTLLTRSSSLRLLLNNEETVAFVENGVADILVPDSGDIHIRLAALHKGLVLHDALVQLLRLAITPEHSPALTGQNDWEEKLIAAIDLARELHLISPSEARYCRFFNAEANRAKRNRFPF